MSEEFRRADVALREVGLVFRSVRDPSMRDVEVLNGINVQIPSGQFVAIIGPSGCGKTTILNLLAGLLRPTVGAVTRGGEEVLKASRDVGYMIARGGLAPWRNARRNVEFGLELRGVDKATRRRVAEATLAKLGLAGFEGAYPSQLSHGMRQRVAIARTLAIEPRLLLMDEPFGALDALTRASVQQEFIRLWEEQRPTVLFVTHDLAEALVLADRVIVMSARPGRIIADRLVPFERPRNHEELLYDSRFIAMERELRGLLT
jgi:NitT/TauT family transport system ATP-binding protein